MTDWHRFTWKSGQLGKRPLSEFWSPTLTAKNPQIPNLPLETAGGPSYVAILKRWTGSAWVKQTLKRWTGSAWVAAVLKVYKDNTWGLVDTTGV